jgi:Lon protease-like protein
VNEAPTDLPELVPVFPLPEVVLFPRQVLPLHIFEPRYRAMVSDALTGERAIAIALLKPDYEADYFTSHAPIHTLVGVGRIIASEKLDDGKYNILLRGEARAKIVEELPGRPYRLARVETILPRCGASAEARRQLRCELFDAIRQHLGSAAECGEHCLQLFETPLSLGELTDLIAGWLGVAGELRQFLLAELETCARARFLLEQLRTIGLVTHRARHVEQHAEWQRN